VQGRFFSVTGRRPVRIRHPVSKRGGRARPVLPCPFGLP